MVKSIWIFLLVAMNCAVGAQPYKILPLGNSITQSDEDRLGYRYYLSELLKDEGIDFDFVGSMTEHYDGTPSYPTAFDQDHEGHWGWNADQIINGAGFAPSDGKLVDWLANYTPDIVLMHLGSNDAFQGQSTASTISELEDIIDLLRLDNPNVIIFLAQLIPTDENPTWNANVDALNADIPSLATAMSTVASPIYVVDQNTGFDPAIHTWDDTHPNNAGALKMAEKWMAAMTALVPLPIELINFEAKPDNGKVNIAWSTASEKNNQHFTLQHSRDGIQFFTIAQLDGAGTSATTLNYSSVHDQPSYGKNYYRLKQTDFDGEFTYSKVIVVNYLEKGAPTIYPNPVVSQWSIDFTMEEYDDRLIQVFDLAGRKHREYNYRGGGVFELDRRSISSGTYIVRITSSKHDVVMHKIIFR